MGYSTWGRKESDTTERLTLSLSLYSWLLKTTFSRAMLGGIGGRRRRRQKDKKEMVGWHHRLDGREFE